MITIDDLSEPAKTYRTQIKDAHEKNAAEFFDELVNKSGINVQANKSTVAEYKKTENKYKKVDKERNKIKNFKTFLIICITLFFILFGIYVMINVNSSKDGIKPLNIVLCILFGIFAIVLLVILKVKINPIIKDKDKVISDLKATMDKLKKEGYEQMAALNALYDWNMSTTIANKTTPLIQLDKYFDVEKYQYMVEKYGFGDNTDPQCSTLFVQSGSILGNPFLIQENYVQDMHNVTYTGSLVISWTETIKVGDDYQTVTRTQTLTASVTNPAPYYYNDTWLVYGNEAAPNLVFYRQPSNANNMSEKQIEKYVKSFDKKLDKMVQKDINDVQGEQFTRLANTKFEALFNALDRNDEIQFRLLFTPLAQKNMIDLITSKEPYGDDFIFKKDHKLNFIKTVHSQNKDFSGNPSMFIDWNYERARQNFIKYNTEYLKLIFFDLAPLISIPLYQQTKTHEYIYGQGFTSNITSYEHEVLANAMDVSKLMHPDTDTNVILKTKFLGKENNKDLVEVTAHSFRIEKRVTYVPVHGGDGYTHDVPVYYDEYIPIEKNSNFYAEKGANTKQEFEQKLQNGELFGNSSQSANINDTIYQRGLLAYLLSK